MRTERARKGNRPATLGARFPGKAESLERRELMAAQVADVAMLGASALNARSLTVDYQVKNADLTQPLVLGVYRSNDTSLSADDLSLGATTIAVGSLDASGKSATAVGTHHLIVSPPGGLPPSPSHPYVLVVANPGTASASLPGHLAAFRKFTIGVIVHGGVQPQSWKASGPPWEARMAQSLRAEGYDLVIPFNWVGESHHPGAAAKQIGRLANLIQKDSQLFPTGAAVDLHAIGHSEGAVIVSQAVGRLQPTSGLAQGYTELTLLDPHAASNAYKPQQVSVSGGMLGSFAKASINAFQSKAKDPAPIVPGNVNDAQVYYQKTPVKIAHTNGGVYNLWGQTPVIGATNVPVHYADLTGPGISHAGDFGVYDWYQTNVVPKLGNGPAFVDPSHLTVHRVTNASLPAGQAQYAGEATPGATISLVNPGIAIMGPDHHTLLSQTVTDATGHWSITSPKLDNYAPLIVRASVPADPGHPRVVSTPSVEFNT